jgi:hypothetical protein
VGDPEVFGKLAVLGDDANMVDGGEPEGLDSREQRGVVDEDRDWGDFNRKPGGYFVPGAVLNTANGMDTNILVGVLVVLVNARRVGEDDGGGNIFLIVKMRERRQGTGRRDRGQRQDGVVERSGRAQTSVCLCGGFYRGRDV